MTPEEIAELRAKYPPTDPDAGSELHINVQVDDDGYVHVEVTKPGGAGKPLSYARGTAPPNLLQAEKFIRRVVDEALKAGGAR
jgi:hypothetical protein